MVRLFIAIDLPDEICEQFMEVQEAISSSRARLTKVATNSMHITLKFIGEVNGSLINPICDALNLIKYPIYSLQVGMISLNSNRSPRIVWAEISDLGKSANLVNLIDTALKPLGIEQEIRKFHPHVTIARIRQFHDSLYDNIATVSGKCSGTIHADKFTLKKSELTPDGPIYTDIISIPLLEP